MTVHTADSAIRAARSGAYYVWVRLADAPRVRLPPPWISGFVDRVNCEDAVLFKHPARERAYVRHLDGDPMTLAEAAYVRATLPA